MRTLAEVQQEIDHLIKEEWHSGYWSPLASLARLTEEVGELAREINHAYGEKPKKSDEAAGDVAGELADILFILASLANSIDIDLDAAFEKVMAKYQRRDARRWQPDEASELVSGSGHAPGNSLPQRRGQRPAVRAAEASR
ncbi:MAG TPA: nucleotide pyrophosphohydrolase [Ktedonobacteraceae bacterium]|jgi:NTP pyrophosphatase (non-canonical NTP hydrolase)